MKKQAVLLVAFVAAVVVGSAQAQDKGQSMIGSEKKTPAAPAADASAPESKIGSNSKTKTKSPVVTENAKAGPYGAGLKKVPRTKKAAPTDGASDTTPK